MDGPGTYSINPNKSALCTWYGVYINLTVLLNFNRDRIEYRSRRTLGIHPVRIEIRQGRLITGVLQRLGGFLVDNTAGTSPPPGLGLSHIGVRVQALRRPSVNLRREGDGTGTGDQ